MNRLELEDALYSKGFVFVNKLVDAVGGSKKGGKVQDILEILSIYDTDATMVVDAYYMLQQVRKERIGNILSIVDDIKENWDNISEYVINNEKTPDKIAAAIDKIDGIIEYIFGFKK